MKNQVKFKIGEIEFEAAGSSEIIEREREYFLNNILPVAVDSIRITKQINATPVYPETFESNNVSFPEQEKSVQSIENISKTTIPYAEEDVSRTNLATFLTEFGDVTEADFILISAYYDEKRNHVESFSVENVKNYYEEARRPKYSNNSALLNQLAKKSLIIEKKPNEKTSRKFYILSKLGIDY
ncbi:hypothetical protein, partial [Enterococcus sp. 12E11_DIV0728]